MALTLRSSVNKNIWTKIYLEPHVKYYMNSKNIVSLIHPGDFLDIDNDRYSQ